MCLVSQGHSERVWFSGMEIGSKTQKNSCDSSTGTSVILRNYTCAPSPELLHLIQSQEASPVLFYYEAK